MEFLSMVVVVVVVVVLVVICGVEKAKITCIYPHACVTLFV
jgi:hypothetical protein